VLATSGSSQSDDLALHLRPGVKFHDGTPFTADDAACPNAPAPTPRSCGSTPTSSAFEESRRHDGRSTNGPNPIELGGINTINS
jgi:hypothetical protein